MGEPDIGLASFHKRGCYSDLTAPVNSVLVLKLYLYCSKNVAPSEKCFPQRFFKVVTALIL
jgi:hypothetical protein